MPIQTGFLQCMIIKIYLTLYLEQEETAMATTFILIIFLILLVCITLAVIVGIFMHINSGESESTAAMLDESAAHNITGPLPPEHNITGPLPPFMLNPTQPLSEIYYHEEQSSNSRPLQTEPHEPTYMPPNAQSTGPLPLYHNNQ